VWQVGQLLPSNKCAVVGPTAVGKTAVTIELARRVGGEIISADSMQVYREMNIGTAKPTPMEQSAVPFHLIDVVRPDEEWTLANYQDAAQAAWTDITSRGRLPLITGGTGLYIRSFTTRLDIPTVPPNESLRAALRAEAVEHGNEWIHGRLREVDPAAADRIHVNDVNRIVRALEIHGTLGITVTELHEQNRALQQDDGSIIIGLNYIDRRELYKRIEQRVDQMIEEGFLAEVQHLMDMGYSCELKPMQSLGYRHLCDVINGNTALPQAVEEIKRDTRHYARRQLIWFRGDRRVQWIDVDGRSVEWVAGEIERILGTDRSTFEGTIANE